MGVGVWDVETAVLLVLCAVEEAVRCGNLTLEMHPTRDKCCAGVAVAFAVAV